MRADAFDTEVKAATEWLRDALLPSESPHHERFTTEVKRHLEERYRGHWYPTEAHRGCAYRSLSCNGSLDPLLVSALKSADIPRDHLLPKDHFILWVNPGEVKVNDAGLKRHIFCSAGSKPNPYSKPKVNVAPTRLNVIASEDDEAQRTGSSSSASSASASPIGSPKPSKAVPKEAPSSMKLSPSAVKFVPQAGLPSSQSSDASDSDGEQEMQPQQYATERVGFVNKVPAFAPMPPMPPMMPPPGLFLPTWQMAPPGVWAAPPPGISWQRAPQGSRPVEAH